MYFICNERRIVYFLNFDDNIITEINQIKYLPSLSYNDKLRFLTLNILVNNEF